MSELFTLIANESSRSSLAFHFTDKTKSKLNLNKLYRYTHTDKKQTMNLIRAKHENAFNFCVELWWCGGFLVKGVLNNVGHLFIICLSSGDESAQCFDCIWFI